MPKRANAPEIMAQLADLLGIQGSLPLLLDEVIVPVAIVSELGSQVAAYNAMGRINTGAGGAGTYCKHSLRNTQDAASDVYVDYVLIENQAVGAFGIQIKAEAGELPAALAANKGWRDGRLQGQPASNLESLTDVTDPGRVIGAVTIPAGTTFILPLGYWLDVMDTNTRSLIIRGAVNTALSTTWFWTERRRGS